MAAKATLGVIIGNRDFFPDKLVAEAKLDVDTLFAKLNITGIMLTEAESKLGGVETFGKLSVALNCSKSDKKFFHASVNGERMHEAYAGWQKTIGQS